jgi:hypothetical protein
VLSELRMMAAWQYSLMGPALLAGAKCMPTVNQQSVVVKAIHTMLEQVADVGNNTATQLITEQRDGEGNITHPFTFMEGVLKEMNMPLELLELKPLHLLAYQRMCQSTATDELVVDLLRVSAAGMMKKQIDMSADLLFKDYVESFVGKSASNTACERSFGFLDWWKKFAIRQKTVRTNGLIMFRVNDTVQWLQDRRTSQGQSATRSLTKSGPGAFARTRRRMRKGVSRSWKTRHARETKRESSKTRC